MRKIVRPEWSIEIKQAECYPEHCTAVTCYGCILDYDETPENLTVVRNLSTGDELHYNLPPKEAVKAAYLQYTLNNYNTWEYDQIEVEYREGKYTIACGDWCALKEKTWGNQRNKV